MQYSVISKFIFYKIFCLIITYSFPILSGLPYKILSYFIYVSLSKF